MMKSVYGLLLFLSSIGTFGQSTQLAKLKYNGGGDWYANKTALPNLMAFCNRELKTNFPSEEDIVEVGSPDLFRYPWIYMTGHGEVTFSDAEARNLRKYLVSGGFLHVDDNYGLDPFIRREMKKVFPELEFVELPFSHPLYNQKFSFPKGLPKVHVHDNKPPQGFALIWEGRVVCFYSYECDLGNGWEDARIHGNPEEVRLAALQMGANLIQYVFTAQ
ncbi:MAG: DUF4159 domain-containing protein [Spirosomataceae bacterium]